MAVALALRRRPGGAAAAAFLILNPVVVATVNGGHNDVLVGAAILAAVTVADRRRLVAAGMLIALAALVKVTALVAVPAIVVWLVRRGQTREAPRFVAASMVPFAIGYVAFGGLPALDGLQKSAGWMSRAALLRWPRGQLVGRLVDARLVPCIGGRPGGAHPDVGDGVLRPGRRSCSSGAEGRPTGRAGRPWSRRSSP